MNRLPDLPRRLFRWRPESGIETLLACLCVYIALGFNSAFWHALLGNRSFVDFATWRLLAATFIALAGVHYLALAGVANRWTVKPLLTVVIVVSAMAAYYMDHYAVFMDPDMLRNVLHTEYKEARELVTTGFVVHVVLWSAVPILLLWRVDIRRRSWPRAVGLRIASVVVAILLTTAGLATGYRDLSALMRNQKEARYLVTPGNVLYASCRALLADARHAKRPKTPIGVDAHQQLPAAAAKPRLLVLIVGETVRAANWGLNGYRRDTTPQLRALNVVNFHDVQSCGTATEVSLPCMFSAIGRRDYDEERILGQESLLHVLDHAGVRTLWRDNQTGCKGVCSGLPFQQFNAAQDPSLCRDGLCFDEILLSDLAEEFAAATGDLVVVLHPLGNHGPSYHLRYPERFRVYTPTCDSADLGDCSNEQIVNSYDNAVLYADHVVAETIRLLARQSKHDSALIYVSDHGESLGEQGIFLHGFPYAIAPPPQTAIPMVTWLSPGMVDHSAIDLRCLNASSARPLTHDNLFHSVLGLLNVQTSVYESSLDVFGHCRSGRGMYAFHGDSVPRKDGPDGTVANASHLNK